MKKCGAQGYLIYAILFVLFSSIVFLMPTQKGDVFWVTYSFAVVAFVVQFFIWKIVVGGKVKYKSRFLGVPVVYVSIAYLIVQITVTFIFSFLAYLHMWLALLINIVIICLSLIFIISTRAGGVSIEKLDQKIEKKFFI